MINTPRFFTGIWAIIKSFLNEVTVNKFIIVGDNYIDKLREHIDDSQIPIELGGSRENFPWNSILELDTEQYMELAKGKELTCNNTSS